MTEHPNNTNTQNDDEIINDEQFDDMRVVRRGLC